MSPERHKGLHHGPPSDIWALGITLAECALGHYPIDLSKCRDCFELMDAMSSGVSFPEKLCVSGAFKDFITQCLQVNPSDRPSVLVLLRHAWLGQWKGSFSLKEYFDANIGQLPNLLPATLSPPIGATMRNDSQQPRTATYFLSQPTATPQNAIPQTTGTSYVIPMVSTSSPVQKQDSREDAKLMLVGKKGESKYVTAPQITIGTLPNEDMNREGGPRESKKNPPKDKQK